MSKTTDSYLMGAAPGVFVLLWSTGFIGAKLGLPDAEPLTFLELRSAIVCTLFWEWRWRPLAWRSP